MAQERQQPIDVRVAETTRNVGIAAFVGTGVFLAVTGIGAVWVFGSGAVAAGAEIYRGRRAKPSTA